MKTTQGWHPFCSPFHYRLCDETLCLMYSFKESILQSSVYNGLCEVPVYAKCPNFKGVWIVYIFLEIIFWNKDNLHGKVYLYNPCVIKLRITRVLINIPRWVTMDEDVTGYEERYKCHLHQKKDALVDLKPKFNRYIFLTIFSIIRRKVKTVIIDTHIL